MDSGLLPRRDSDTLDTYYLRSRKVYRGQFDEFQDITEVEEDISSYSTFENKAGSRNGSDATSVILLEDGVGESEPVPRRLQPPGWGVLLLCLITGVVYGVFIDKSRITRPHTIRNQFMLRQWTYTKVLLTAMAVGQVLLCVLVLIPSRRDSVYSSMRTFNQWLRGHGVLAVLVGSSLMGAGTALSGACPTTLFVQLGTLSANSVYTMLGAVAGALCYGILEARFMTYLRPHSHMKRQTLFGKLSWWYPAVALPVCGLVTLILFYLHRGSPWYRELHPEDRNRLFGPNSSFLSLRSWPPFAAGVAMGVVQTLLVLFVEDTLDDSRATQTISAQWVFSENLQQRYPYLARFKTGQGRWWPVFLSFGMLLGGLVSSLMAGSFAKTPGVTVLQALGGGFLLMLGARVAGGGTSRHLSGCSMLFVLSLLALPCFFGSGYGTARLLHAYGKLNFYRSW